MRLGEVCESVSVTFRRQLEKVVLINTSDVLEGKVTNHAYVPNENLRGQFKKSFQQGDILYSEIRPKNRRFAFVDFDASDYVASTKLMVIRANERVLPEFLFQALKSDDIINRLQLLAETRSGTFPQITFSELAALDVRIPSIDEQREIAAIFRALDDKIANNSKINHHLEQMAQAIFKSWFVDFEPWGGVMPDDWQEGSLGDYVEIKRGGSPRPIQDFLSDSGLRWLKISDVTSLQTPFVLEIKEHIKESGLKKTVFLKSGALVLSNSATPGIPKILGVDTCIHDGWLYFPKSRFSNEFLYLFFKHIRQDLVALGNGSVFTNLKTDILKAYPVVVPDEATMRRFNDTVEPIFRGLENCTRESAKIASMRDSLLPRLMSSELSAHALGDAK
jgi:type I restriction enzyme S subunit